jgi:hypothetical protein
MKTLLTPFILATALSVVAILATCGCSVVNETTGVDTSASTRVEVGSRTVLGLVFFDAIGFGIFLPSKVVSDLQTEGGK